MIPLTKAFIGDSQIQLSFGGKYITNGHWVIASVEQLRSMFPKAEILEIDEDFYQPVEADLAIFHKTQWIHYNHGDEACLFVGGETDSRQLWLKRKYVERFELEVVKVESTSADDGAMVSRPASVGDMPDFDIVVAGMWLEYLEGAK